MLIEQDALKHWTKGSYEYLRQETSRALKESGGVCEINFAWRLVATFPSHAIIVSDKGNFYRCTLEETASMGRKLVAMDPIQGPRVYKLGEEKEYYRDKFTEVVDRMLESKDVSALVETMMRADGDSLLAESITEQLQTLIDGRNLWNSYYYKNEYRITRASWKLERYEAPTTASKLASEAKELAERSQELLRGCESNSVHAVNSVYETCVDLEYWLSKLSTLESQSLNGAVSKGLIECLHKMDMLITYSDGLRGRR